MVASQQFLINGVQIDEGGPATDYMVNGVQFSESLGDELCYNKLFGKGNYEVPDQFLRGYWALQDDAGTSAIVDSSGLGNDLALTDSNVSNGVTTTGPTTWLSKAIAFDGSFAAEGAVASDFDSVSQLSLACWAKPDAYGGNARGRMISIGNTDVNLYTNDFTVSEGVSAFVETATASLASAGAFDTWIHWALDYDVANIRLYKNGVAVATQAKTGSISLSANILRIGNDSTAQFGFSGPIAGVSALTRSKSAEEYQEEMAGPEPFLLTGSVSISGTVARGSTITLNPGTWSSQNNGAITYHYYLYSYSDTSRTDERLE